MAGKLNIGTIQALNARLNSIMKKIDLRIQEVKALYEGGKDACGLARLNELKGCRELIEEQIHERPKKEDEE